MLLSMVAAQQDGLLNDAATSDSRSAWTRTPSFSHLVMSLGGIDAQPIMGESIR